MSLPRISRKPMNPEPPNFMNFPYLINGTILRLLSSHILAEFSLFLITVRHLAALQNRVFKTRWSLDIRSLLNTFVLSTTHPDQVKGKNHMHCPRYLKCRCQIKFCANKLQQLFLKGSYLQHQSVEDIPSFTCFWEQDMSSNQILSWALSTLYTSVFLPF